MWHSIEEGGATKTPPFRVSIDYDKITYVKFSLAL